MTHDQITHLGNVTAKAAIRAIQSSEGGLDRNQGQFIYMVLEALESIPEEFRGEETQFFIKKFKKNG